LAGGLLAHFLSGSPHSVTTMDSSYGPMTSNLADNRLTPYAASLPLTSAGLPMRPGELPCSFFLKTGQCKFGPNCKWDHPEGEGATMPMTFDQGTPDGSPLTSQGFPIRPGFPFCAYYLKTGSCKFGAMCKHDHPEDRSTVDMPDQLAAASAMELPPMLMMSGTSMPGMSGSMAGSSNPIRPGEMPCQFWLKTGSCKFGQACKWDHPTGMPGFPTQGGGMVGMGGGMAVSTKDALVSRIKAYQRSGEEPKQQWWLFCDTQLSGIRDPSRHDVEVLEQFISQFFVP